MLWGVFASRVPQLTEQRNTRVRTDSGMHTHAWETPYVHPQPCQVKREFALTPSSDRWPRESS